MPRPLTHDLMKDMLGALEIKVEQVLITELRASTYYAELHLRRGEERTIVSSRPSDAVAVAVRTETPIFVADELMESEGIILAIERKRRADEVPEELVGEFRQFLESVRPGGLRRLMRAGRILRVVATLACGGLIAAACSSGTPEHDDDHHHHHHDVHRTTTTTGVTPTTASTTTTGIASCTQVSVTPGQTQGAAGTIIGTVTLTAVGTGHLHDRGLPESHPLQLERRRRADHRGAGIDRASRGSAVPAAGAGHPVLDPAGRSSPSSTPMSSPARRPAVPSRPRCRSPRPGATSPSTPVPLSISACNNGTVDVSPIYAATAERRVRPRWIASRRGSPDAPVAPVVSYAQVGPAAPFGRWPSPLDAADAAAGKVSLSELCSDGTSVYWLESRPRDGGRVVLVRGDDEGVVDLSARRGEHSQPCPRIRRGRLLPRPRRARPGAFAYVDASDQRVWLQTRRRATPHVPSPRNPPTVSAGRTVVSAPVRMALGGGGARGARRRCDGGAVLRTAPAAPPR